MKTSDFDYELPQELIAQTPAERRDGSRLLCYNRSTGQIAHRHFHDVVEYLDERDVLVINETKVIPARLIGKREDSGGAMEFLLLRRLEDGSWETLVKPGKRGQDRRALRLWRRTAARRGARLPGWRGQAGAL